MAASAALRRAARWLACRLGAHHAGRWRHQTRLLIVCYHGVGGADRPDDWLIASREDFERQIAYLADHYEIRPIDEALDTLWSGCLHRPTACITFDDGYRNNLTVAAPVLARYGVPATVYLTTDLIGGDGSIWTVELDQLIRRTRRREVDLSSIGLGEARLGSDRERAGVARRLIARLKELPDQERCAVSDALTRELGPVDPLHPDCQLMTWDDVRRAPGSAALTFGAHTCRHVILSRVDDQDVEREVGGSIRRVSYETTARSATFAYPNGRPVDFDARAIRAAREAGVRAAVTTIEGLNAPDTDPFQLRRVVIGADTDFDAFRLRCAGLGLDALRLTAASGSVPGAGGSRDS